MLILKAINIYLAVGLTGMQLGSAKAMILDEICTLTFVLTWIWFCVYTNWEVLIWWSQ